jgi:hypothetical protein
MATAACAAQVWAWARTHTHTHLQLAGSAATAPACLWVVAYGWLMVQYACGAWGSDFSAACPSHARAPHASSSSYHALPSLRSPGSLYPLLMHAAAQAYLANYLATLTAKLNPAQAPPPRARPQPSAESMRLRALETP